MLCAPLGVGAGTDLHFPPTPSERGCAAAKVCDLDGWFVLAAVPPPEVELPHAASTSPKDVAPAQQSKRVAAERTSMRGSIVGRSSAEGDIRTFLSVPSLFPILAI